MYFARKKEEKERRRYIVIERMKEKEKGERGEDEGKKSRPGDERAGGIRRKFTRDEFRDSGIQNYIRDIHFLHDNCITRSNLICQFYILAGSRSVSIFGQQLIPRDKTIAPLRATSQGRRLIISYHRVVSFVRAFAHLWTHEARFTSPNLFYMLMRTDRSCYWVFLSNNFWN